MGPDSRFSDLEIVADRLRAEFLSELVPAQEAAALHDRLTPDGYWPDIDYADTARTHWSPSEHTHRLARLARAYHQTGLELAQPLCAALAFWVARDPQSDNWWFNCIDTPRYLAPVLLLVGDLFPRADCERAVQIVRRSSLERTGANLTWEAGNLLVLACATRDVSLFQQAAAAIAGEIRVTDAEGIQPDWSFHQHGPQLYMSNYGEVFAAENSRYARLFAGTGVALNEQQIAALSGLVREGQQWFLWGRQFDYHALGRQLDRPDAAYRGAGMIAVCARLAQVDPSHAAEYEAMIARLSGHEPPGSSGPRGSRHYWRSDVTVHRPGHFCATVRMHSARTLTTEVRVNRENLQGYHLADGVCFLLQRGDEYHGIQPVWDWRKLPGATCRRTADPLPYGRDVEHRGSTDFVGGVSDGQVALTTLDYDRDGVQAHKTWFFLPDGWVCLGAGLHCTTGEPLTTSINQCLLQPGTALLRHGRIIPLTGEHFSAGDLEGVYHDGVGYYFLQPAQVTVRAAAQSGRWDSIEERSPDHSLVTRDVFSLWIDHPAPVQNADYAYRVVPGLTAETFPGALWAPVEVVSNEPTLQAIAYPAEGLLQAAFYAPGTVDAGGVHIAVDAACLLMLRREKGRLTLSLADPTQRLERIHLCLTGRWAGSGCTYDRSAGRTTVAISLPAEDQAGKTTGLVINKRNRWPGLD